MIIYFQKMTTLILALLSLLHMVHAQNAVFYNDGVQESHAQKNKTPFLSTTVSAKVAYNSESLSSSVLQFDSARKSTFSLSLADFLTKIFSDQQVYDLKIIGVNIFDDHVLHNGQYVEGSSVENQVRYDGETILSFSMVISAEYTSENQMDSISSETFRKILVHVCEKFQSHLLTHLQDMTDDSYFMYVKSISLGVPERVQGNRDQQGSHVTMESKEDLADNPTHVASIVAIVVGGILFIMLSFAAVKYHR
jgi:hypothetical protein